MSQFFSSGGGGGTASPLTTKGDLYTYDTDNTRLPRGVLTSDLVMTSSNMPSWSNTSSTDLSVFVEDIWFENDNWQQSIYGVGSKITSDGSQPTSGHPGIVDLETGTDTNGGAAIRRGLGGQWVLNNGAYMMDYIIKIPVLADVTDDFVFTIGLATTMSSSSAVGDCPGSHAVFFKYIRSSSVNWTAGTHASSSETLSTGGSSVAVDTNWTHLRSTVNADATEVEFFVNGTSIGTVTTNIPSAGMGVGMVIKKTAGTTEREAYADYLKIVQNISPSRFS